MSEEKKYSAKEAAIAVLKKAEEMLKKAELDKCSGTFTKVHEKAKREGYSEASADKIAGHAKALAKNEEPKGEIHPKEPQAGEAEQPGARIKENTEPQPTEINPKQNGNPEWGTTPGVVKGHFKLAKFCGHVSAKRKAKMPPQGAM